MTTYRQLKGAEVTGPVLKMSSENLKKSYSIIIILVNQPFCMPLYKAH